MKKYVFYTILFYCSSVLAADPLSELAVKYGTDKGPIWHNYTPIYHNHFTQLRDKSIKFLEIGFWKGASAHMWEEYFPNAELHFIDINQKLFKEYGQDLSRRCFFHVVNQSDSSQIDNFINKVNIKFDIILDDGGHTMTQQINTFKALFPYVKAGGIYIIEDLHTSYWEKYYKNMPTDTIQAKKGTTVAFFKRLIDDVNVVGARIARANFEKCPEKTLQTLNYFQKNIKSIHFYDSLCFVIKR
ncbi:class I SAM-dependent methyltransferase [Candidatus Dependentiae bacterium]|nr:class I SAM-dependent methyltransferase [Candidatus Dependentiae bacterium]